MAMERDQMRPHLREVLTADIHHMLARIDEPLVAEIEAAARPVRADAARPLAAACIEIGRWLEARHQRIEELQRLRAKFSARIARISGSDDRRAETLDFALALGATSRGLRGDAKAFDRWFDFEAVAERCDRMIAREERRLAFGLGRLGKVAAASILAESPGWHETGVEAAFVRGADHGGDTRVRTAAIMCLRDALAALPGGDREKLLGERALTVLLRLAFARNTDVASEIAALDALSRASMRSFSTALRERLQHPGEGDDFWVRRAAVRLLCEYASEVSLRDLFAVVLRDPSPAVRQALAAELHHAPDQARICIESLAHQDEAKEVRAATLAVLPMLADRLDQEFLIKVLERVMREDEDDLVLRTAFHAAAEIQSRLEPSSSASFATRLMPEVESLHGGASTLAVRRWAAQAREQLWCQGDVRAAPLLRELRAMTAHLREGKALRVPAVKQALREDPDLVARVLAVLAQRDFGYELSASALGRAPRLRRGERFGFRLWRAWHELWTASPEKRQGHSHTIGRVFDGDIVAPSVIMAELAPTKVPGEPVHFAEEDGWRPYLPLPDLALSALDKGAPVRIATSEGVTEISPPKSFLRRLRSRISLTRRFAEFSALRNWTSARPSDPDAYLATLRTLGFTVRIRGYREAGGSSLLDPSVARFFPVALPFLPADLWRRLEVYFFSIYQNTLWHLAVFLAAVGLFFVGRHAFANARIRRARRALPLVIGGWGTRGKSGTERIKAALMNGLGLSVVSKTTGNEAMFLQGDAFGQLHELFLYRPYDKATIWEQADVTRLAHDLKADTLLWECMALNPSYVTVLQRHWMRDDISTITNTYPDHEDIQGPAGRNIPEVMTKFIPRKSVLLTSEEQMRPILAQAAEGLGTRLEGVGWLEAGLLPPEALARFPYEEHPYNIALVLKLADEIGVDRDFALKEMADRVVPDLGVLKSYPVAEIAGRRLEFVMGMSANERFGAYSNWVRMGFHRQDPYEEPGVWLSAVVNNRADRVPRSQVFAEFLVQDVSLDRIVLIGSNLSGMRGYLDEAWARFEASLTLFPDRGAQTPAEMLEAGARRMRIPYRRQHVIDRSKAMLERLGFSPDTLGEDEFGDRGAFEKVLGAVNPEIRKAAGDHVEAMAGMVREYAQIEGVIAAGGPRDRPDRLYRDTMRRWFESKITIVEDFHATGDAVIAAVAEVTPPGILNRVMGVQNIKGTGLDFVYKWQAWEQVSRACDMAESNDPHTRSEGIRRLTGFKEYGLASESRVRRSMSWLKRQADFAPALAAQVEIIERALEEQLKRVREEMGRDRSNNVGGRLASMIEALLEPADGILRKREAQRIYRDLADERISRPRAAYELKRVNARQKEGWLLSGRREVEGSA